MPSNQPSQTDHRAADLWRTIIEIYAEVSENQSVRLRAEASWFGLEDPDLLNLNLNPEAAVRLFEQENPEVDLDHLDEADPYDVAVGVLKIYAG